jgi:O-antigen ligase
MMLLLLQIMLLLAMTFSFSYESARRLLTYSCAASAILGLYIISGYLTAGGDGYGGVLRENYLVLATAVGIGAVGATLHFVALKGARGLWGVAALLLLLALALSLARGALLSSIFVILLFTVVALMLQPATGPSSRRWRGGMMRFGLVAAVLSLSVFLAFRVDFFRDKLEELLAGEIGPRRDVWKTALTNLEGAGLFGHGLGSSGLLSERVASGYPHNLFLQVWLDGGLVAMLLMLVIALLPFALVVLRLWRRRLTDLIWLPPLGIYLFVLLEYSKSFDFYTARALLIFGVGALWLLSAENYKTERSEPQTGAKARRRQK